MEGIALPGGYQHPPGFRFHPSDQELIIHYLTKKATGTLPPASAFIADIDLYKFNPWDLPDKALFGEGEWFFFSPRDRKYPGGVRPNRAAGSGYWKATGTDKPILGGTKCIGVKKVLVFYKGRPPKGIKTEWVMHEYRLLGGNNPWTQKHRGTMRLDDWVLCRVQQKRNPALLGEEKFESSNISSNIAPQQNTQSIMEKENAFKWGDYQLLSYLMDSAEENESTFEGDDKGSAGSSGSNRNGSLDDIISGGCKAETQLNLVSSDLQSIKRNLSAEALEDILLLPPSKGLNCSDAIGQEQPSNIMSGHHGHVFYLD